MGKVFILTVLITFMVSCRVFLSVAENIEISSGSVDAENGTIVVTGQIQRFSSGAGFWVIKTDDGTMYHPQHLDVSYQRAGLGVRATVRPVGKKSLTSGWAIPVDVLSLERVDSSRKSSHAE